METKEEQRLLKNALKNYSKALEEENGRLAEEVAEVFEKVGAYVLAMKARNFAAVMKAQKETTE